MSEQALPPITEVSFRTLVANSRFPLPPGTLSGLQNMYIKDGKILPRRGLLSIATGYTGTAQCAGHYETLAGVLKTFWIAGGVIYFYDWTLDTTSTIDINLQSVTISTTAEIEYCISRGRLIITDGVNKPIMYDGTTWTQLTNAPIGAGCEIYYDKVFFYDIPGAENQFEWSDEADPVNGYTPEDQAWEFAQTDTGRIVGLAGLNEVLVIFKDDSIARLLGNADATFQADAVREGISETEGCAGRKTIVVVDGDVYFLSISGPKVILGGQSLRDPARDENGNFWLEDIWATLDKENLSSARGVFDKRNRQIIWFVPRVGDTGSLYYAIVYDVDTRAWTTFLFTPETLFVSGVESAGGRDLILMLDNANNALLYGDSTEPSNDNGSTIVRRVQSRPLGQDYPTVKLRLVEARVLFDSIEGSPVLTVSPVIDGTTDGDSSRLVAFPTVTGKHRYRRGFNAVGWDVGVEILGNRLGNAFSISALEVFLTAVESIGDRNDS